MTLQKTELIILRRTRIQDSSLFFTCLTPDWGKISLVARAAVRPGSATAEALQYFVVADVVFYQREKKGSDYVSKAEVGESFDRISDDEQKFGYASAALELVSIFLADGECNREVYYLLKRYLRMINLAEKGDFQSQLLQFWYQLCIFSGYAPEISGCIRCGGAVMSEHVMFNPEVGGVVCPDCLANSETALRIQRGVIQVLERWLKSDIDNRNSVALSTQQKRQISDLLTALTEYHVGKRADLKSFEFLRKLRPVSEKGE